MNTSETVALIQLTQGATIFGAQYMLTKGSYSTSKTYHFKNNLGIDLEVGDTIVVQSRDAFDLVTVTSLNVPHTSLTCTLGQLVNAVQKVDFTGYEKVKANEATAVLQLGMSELHERLEVYRKQLNQGTFENIASILSPPTLQKLDTAVSRMEAASPSKESAEALFFRDLDAAFDGPYNYGDDFNPVDGGGSESL
jgi:hypothetical protein